MTNVTLVHGAPGCGKTTTIIDAVEKHVEDDGLDPWDVYLANFTRNGREDTAEDLITRGVFDLSEYHEDVDQDTVRGRCRTVHSIALQSCSQIEDPDQVITMEDNPEFYAEFCRKHGLSFEREERNPLRIIHGEDEATPKGNKLFAMNQWLHSRYHPDADRHTKISKVPVDLALSNRRIRDLLDAWESYKADNGKRVEHHDYVDLCIQHNYGPDVRLLAIDEFQDLAPAEYALYKQWRDEQNIDWIYIAGDVNQCVPEGTPVQTRDGPIPIEEITEGDEVVSAYDDGEAKSFEVTATHDRPANEPIVSLATESGATVSCTRNHEMFAVLPNQRQSNGDAGDRHFVYVMKSASGDYRVGITQMPRKRFTTEQGAAAMMIVGAHETEEAALLEEKQIAYEYGIPQTPFKNRGGLYQSALNELYGGLDTDDGFYDLCKDKDLNPERFHLVAQSDDTATSEYQVSGEHVRVSLKLGKVRERKNGSDYVYHQTRAVTANGNAIEKLRETQLNESDAKADGSVRFRLQSSDYGKVRDAAQDAVDGLHEAGIGGELCEEATYGSFDESGGRRVPLLVVPASQVTEGMYVPVVSDGSVQYEQVVHRTEQKESTTVYDLTVPPTHNYIVGGNRGVAVHNSIYSFRCATPTYLQETAVDDREYLTDSYRCPVEVSNVARGILESEPSISRNIFRTARRHDGKRPQGTATMRQLEDPEDIAAAVRTALDNHGADNGATVYMLARTNYQLGILANALQREGQPFDAIGDKMTPWPGDIVSCLLALRSLRRESPVPKTDAKALIDTATNSELRWERYEAAESSHELQSDMESVPVCAVNKVAAAFPGRSVRTISDVLDIAEYRKDMLRGALETDVDPNPDRVQIGTVHEAKGLEAPCVFLFAETTPGVLKRYQSGEVRAEEHRVAYVGATRASETLHVVEGLFDSPTSPIFEDGLPGHARDADRTSGGVTVDD
jgi:superfamily I DNA/RNA helicase